MGKASDLERRLRERPLGPGELWPLRPELRVRSDTPAIEVDGTTSVKSVLDRLNAEQRDGVVLRGTDGGTLAVVLSAGRYAELAGCEVESEDRFRAFEGKIEPDPEALKELMIEPVDPTAEWTFGSRIWRKPGQP